MKFAVGSDEINETARSRYQEKKLKVHYLVIKKKGLKCGRFNGKKIMAKYGQRIVKFFYHDQFCIFR